MTADILGAVRISPTLRHLVSWGLPGGPQHALDLASEHVPDPATTAALADEIRSHRVTGVVLTALDEGATTQPPEGLRAAVVERHHLLLQQTLLAEADLVRVIRCLDDHHIETRVLKGLAAGHLDYADPAQRMTSDVDILVRPDQLGAATSAVAPLTDLATSVPDRRARHVDRYGKDRTLHLRSGGWLDLHRLLVPAYWGLSLPASRCFERSERFDVGGTTMSALAPSDRLLNALLHAGATEEIKIQSFRDVIVLLDRADLGSQLIDDPTLRPVHGLIARGIQRVGAIFDVELPLAEWAQTVEPTWREKLALRVHNLDGRRDHWTGPLGLPIRNWPGYLWPLISPSKEYRAWYGRTRTDHIRSAAKAVTSRR